MAYPGDPGLSQLPGSPHRLGRFPVLPSMQRASAPTNKDFGFTYPGAPAGPRHPAHRSCGGQVARTPPRRARWPRSPSRKTLDYGKTKKWSHGRPARRRARLAYPGPRPEEDSRVPRQARPRPAHRPKSAAAYPGPRARQRNRETPLHVPVWRAHIGEIEAKDGLPSADRNNKATLLLTGPFRTAKSYAKDLTPLVLKLQYAKYHDALRAPWRNRLLRR